MQFLAPRCAACSSYPQEELSDYSSIPYCSNCASTTTLLPDPVYSSTAFTKPSPQPQHSQSTEFDQLSNLFTKNLTFQPPQSQSLPTPPVSPPAQATSFPVSGHYNLSNYYYPSHIVPSTNPAQSQNGTYHKTPPPAIYQDDDMMDEDPASSQLQAEFQAAEGNGMDEYTRYLLTSDLSSPNSSNAVAIAAAHQEQEQQQQLQKQQEQQRALEEKCSASQMLAAAAREREMWNNETYGGLDNGMDDEEAPCFIGFSAGGHGGRLRPFDYY